MSETEKKVPVTSPSATPASSEALQQSVEKYRWNGSPEERKRQ
jgi:hypothetical protein